MSGNTTTSNNFTGLYGASGGTVVPTTPYGNANVVSLLAVGTDGANTVGNISATGNVTANYFLGNGSQLTGITSSYGNANVTTLLANFGANTISTTGNITGGNLITTGQVTATGNIATAGFFLGTFAGNISGNLTVPGANTQVLFNNNGNAGASAGFTFDSASNLAIVTGNIVGGNLSTAGNVTGAFILGNGSQLTGLPATYGNANVVANLAALGSNPVSTTGNVSAGYFIGNGSLLTAIPAGNITGQVANALVAGTVYTPAQPNITSVGTLTSLSVSGNITGANLAITTDAVIQGNLTVNGNTTFINSNTVTINDKFINVANNAATAAAANGGGLGVGPVGAEYASLTYNSTSNSWNTSIAISATGNVGGNFFIGNGSQLTGVVATSVGILPSLSVTGNTDTGNLRTAGLVSATGNVTSGNILTTAVQATGSGGVTLKNSAGTAQASYGAGGGDNFAINVSTNLNGNNAQIDISPTGTGHVHIKPAGTGAIEIAPTSTGSINNMVIGNATPAAVNATTASASGNVTGGNIITAGIVSATGNIAGNFFIGNGSLLTGISGGGTYGNANVSNFLANGFGSNSISTTGNISAGNAALTGNLNFGAVTVRNYNNRFNTGDTQIDGNFLVVGTAGTAQLTAATGNLDLPGALSATGNVQGGNIVTAGLITATGNVTAGNIITAGIVSAAGNVLANSAALTGNLSFGAVVVRNNNNRLFTDDAEFVNLDIGSTLDVNGVMSASGNVTGGNILTVGQVSATGNVTGAFIIGNGSQLTGITNTYGNANVSNFLANGFGSNTIVTTGNITANNFTTGNVVTLGGTVTLQNFNNRFYLGDTQVDANLTITGGANQVTITGATGNITTPGLISATGNVQGGNILTVGQVSATGNVTGNFFIGNGSQLTGIAGGGGSPGGANTQIQFNNANAFAGNANLTFNNTTGNVNLGNVIFTTSNATNFINTVAPLTGIPGNVTAFSNSQIVIGNGWQGNLNINNMIGPATGRGSKLLYWDTVSVVDSGGPRISGIGSQPNYSLTANIANANTRLSAMTAVASVGGGANNFQLTTASQFAVTGMVAGVNIGQSSTTVAIGNTVVNNSTGIVANMPINGASNVGNSMALFASTGINSTAAYAQTLAGLVVQFTGTPSVISDNVYGVYMNGNTSQGIFQGTINSNGMRRANNYYFLRNDDNLAQNKLGSLRLFNEYRYDGANTTGTLAVDKNNGQVQNVYLTGNITSVTFSNFVTSATDGTTTDYQTDTVTLILRQDSTGYTVTMPTGSAYKYAAGTTTVGTTANSATMISVTATYDSITAADQYLITISPEFT
jgi:hypothetical protein